MSENIVSYEDTIIFLISNFQYVVCCLAFSQGKPFRRPLYTNISYTTSVLVLILFNTILVLANLPEQGFIYWSFLNLLPLPHDYKIDRIALAILFNTILTFAAEYLISECIVRRADEAKAKDKISEIDDDLA